MGMARKKKGFTLVELLVTLACAAIFLACLSTSMVLLSRLGGRVLDQSADQYKLGVLADYVRSLNLRDTADAPVFVIDDDGGVSEGERLLFSASNISGVSFFQEGGFIRCRVEHDAGEYVFICGVSE